MCDKKIKPVLKWVGGKRQLLITILKLLPSDLNSYKYYEPFIGGGAILFYKKPLNGVISDVNEELINLYNVIKYNVYELIDDLYNYENDKNFYYQIRCMDRDKEIYSKLSDIKKASRMIYLNKTCFRGLYRVNSKNQFNVPYGNYKNPKIIDKENLLNMSKYLNDNNIKILHSDFEDVLNDISEKSFVYLDPPYDPVSKTSSFTNYTCNGFDKDSQIRLKRVCDKLNKRGIKFLLSNSDTEFINKLYSDYTIKKIKARRLINIKNNNINEVLIYNY